MRKERLDAIVLRKGWAVSRDEAADFVRNGRVRVNSLVRTDPSVRAEYDHVSLADSQKIPSYASRGGDKLSGALDFFGLSVSGLRMVDLGASTGGFTDCLLKAGALSVQAVDVGKGLLDDRLRKDVRVTLVESANVRYPGDWMPDGGADGVVVDLSFISLRHVLGSVRHLLREGGFCLSLVKPQFEARPEEIERGGVVRSIRTQKEILRRVLNDFDQSGCELRGMVPSSLRGRKGNQEYFFLTKWKGST